MRLALTPLFLGTALCSAVLLVVASVARAETAAPPTAGERSDNRLTAPIINGAPVEAARSPVAKVNLTLAGESYLCSGALIAPRVVLTAWHCVGGRPSDISVILNRKRFAVARYKVHPRVIMNSQGWIANDVALLYLTKAPATPTIALLTSRTPRVNDQVQVIGYGLDEYGDYGVLREGLARVDAVNSSFVQTLFQSFDQSNSCGGDSGGPAILTYQDSRGRRRSGVIGTVSTGSRNDCMPGDRTFYVNIQSAAVLRFILSNAPGVRQQ